MLYEKARECTICTRDERAMGYILARGINTAMPICRESRFKTQKAHTKGPPERTATQLDSLSARVQVATRRSYTTLSERLRRSKAKRSGTERQEEGGAKWGQASDQCTATSTREVTLAGGPERNKAKHEQATQGKRTSERKIESQRRSEEWQV